MLEPLLGFVLLAFLVVISYLGLEAVIERGLKIKSGLVPTLLKTFVLLLICYFIYRTLPFFSEIFSS